MVEVLHAPHPKLGGLLLVGGEHFTAESHMCCQSTCHHNHSHNLHLDRAVRTCCVTRCPPGEPAPCLGPCERENCSHCSFALICEVLSRRFTSYHKSAPARVEPAWQHTLARHHRHHCPFGWRVVTTGRGHPTPLLHPQYTQEQGTLQGLGTRQE